MQTTYGRIPPALPAHAYKTYVIAAPLATHWRGPVPCSEYQCKEYLNGWDTPVDERTDLGQRQAHYIRAESGRRFTEERDDAGLTWFHFEPGQQGFASRTASLDHSRHMVRLDREEIFAVRGGDWRGNPARSSHVHTRAGDWADDFANHQGKLATAYERG